MVLKSLLLSADLPLTIESDALCPYLWSVGLSCAVKTAGRLRLRCCVDVLLVLESVCTD